MAEIVKRDIDPTAYDAEFLLGLYRSMVRQRTFDLNLIRLLHEGKVSGFYHSGVGQEATGAGTCASLRDDDYILYDHRGCNQMIAKGVPLDKIYGDFMGRVCGTTCGLGAGIVHVAWPEKGVLGQSGTLGACFVIAAGVGYAVKAKKTDQVCVCYFGDGTAARETFHGGMNWAGLYNLPIVFYCENNEYGISTHYTRAHALKENIADRADGYGIPGYVIDGNDVLLVYEVAKEAIERARSGGGPTFIEGKTYRHRGHFEGDPATYRDEAEVEEWKRKRDPIVNYRARLIGAGVAAEEDFARIDAEVEREILDAIALAEQSPMPECDRLYEGLYAEGGVGEDLTMMQAINEALLEEMERNPDTVYYGEDVAAMSGAFGATAGLLDRFGPERVFDTPIAEATIAGAALGMALAGLTPITEFSFADFVGIAFDEIYNKLGKWNWMHGGCFRIPVTIRLPVGALAGSGPEHSQSPQALFMNSQGLYVVVPSTPADAKGLLKTAIRDPNPVLFFEHKLLYGMPGEVPEEEYTIPFGVADVKREGSDVTVIATSMQVYTALNAAGMLAAEGIEVEVIDPRTIIPLDREAILASVRKTGRVVIIHEEPKTGGTGAEMAAIIAEEAFFDLAAPIKRVASADTPIPQSIYLEQFYKPNEEKLVAAIREVMQY